jgi:hypothetical protein
VSQKCQRKRGASKEEEEEEERSGGGKKRFGEGWEYTWLRPEEELVQRLSLPRARSLLLSIATGTYMISLFPPLRLLSFFFPRFSCSQLSLRKLHHVFLSSLVLS